MQKPLGETLTGERWELGWNRSPPATGSCHGGIQPKRIDRGGIMTQAAAKTGSGPMTVVAELQRWPRKDD